MPLDRIIEITPDQKIGVWVLSESVSELLDRLPGLADSPDLERKRSQRQKAEWLATRMLFAEMGYDYREIAYHSSGRPVLADQSGFISVSHSGERVAVMFSRHTACGIDVQLIKGDSVLKGIYFFLNEEEQLMVEGSQNPLLAAFVCWSAKEACFKMAGQPGSDLKSFLLREIRWKSAFETVVILGFGEGRAVTVNCSEKEGYTLAFCSDKATDYQSRIF